MIHTISNRETTALRRGILLAMLMLVAAVSYAESALKDTWPMDDMIELPDFIPPAIQPGSILPPVQIMQQQKESLYAGDKFVLNNIQFTGNSVLSSDDLNHLAAAYLNRPVDLAELQALRDRITLEYIQQGYISSGAVLPDQTITNGVVHIQIIEGHLSEVHVETDGLFNTDYFAKRLALAAKPVVNIKQLEQRLFLFQQDPRIKNIAAELKPGEQPGLSLLDVAVKENEPVTHYVEINNHHTPSIGAEGIYANWRHGNWNGEGEILFLGLEATQGLIGVDALYEWSLNAKDDSLNVFAKINQSKVIDGVFEALDIESRSRTLGMSFKHPLQRTRDTSFDWFATAELRKSESFLLGDGFSFSPGPENGVSRLSVIRTGPDVQTRSTTRILAARATLSVGVDIFNATRHDDAQPDGEFISLLLQGQWAQRLPWFQSTLLSRIDMQFTDSPLLGLEQFAIGGHNTVRGYRENSLVRDQGAVASIEWRIPYSATETGNKHEVALFTDVGYAENKNRETIGLKTINSVGMGLVGHFTKQLSYQLYWAEALKDLTPIGEDDLQDDGVHFRMGYSW